MKALASVTLALISLLFMFRTTSAYAEEQTNYPENDEFTRTLTFSALNDYGVSGELYAFADDKALKVYENGNYFECDFGIAVTDVKITENAIYCATADGKAYTVTEKSDGKIKYGECEYSAFPKKENNIFIGGCLYYTGADAKFYVYNIASDERVDFAGTYVNLKSIDNKIYAVKENALYFFSEAKWESVILNYTDFDAATQKITIGSASTSLKSYSKAKFVTVAAGAYMTEINSDRIDGEYFTAVQTVQNERDMPALLLCYSGNAALIAANNKCYLLLKSQTSELEDGFSKQESFDARILGQNIYSAPFVCDGTVSTPDATEKTVKVVGKVENQTILGRAFYEIEYSKNGENVKGYVAEGFLTKVILNENNTPQQVADPAFSDNADTKTMLIILAVITLVLIAIGYLSHVGGKKKNKKHKKKNPNDDDSD